jgi:peptide deformylase
MAIKNIVKIWDGENLSEENVKFLKLKTKKVTFPSSDFIKDIIQDLIDTYKQISCAGIAANQIGYDYQIFIGMKSIEDENEAEEIEKKEAELSSASGNPYADNYEIYINPQIDKVDSQSIQLDEEGCLSIPGLMVGRERYDKIKIRYYDVNGAVHKCTFSGFLSKLFQHELDHLNGELMIDNLEKIENLYPLEANEENAKLYGNLYSAYQKLTK